MSTYTVIGEIQNSELNAMTAQAVGAITGIGGTCHVIVLGQDPSSAAETAASINGVEQVTAIRGEGFSTYDSKVWAEAIDSVAEQGHVTALATPLGMDLIARLAAVRGIGVVQDAIGISEEGGLSFNRPVYAGKAIQAISADGPTAFTLRGNTFPPAEEGGNAGINVVDHSAEPAVAIKEAIAKASERIDVSEANIIISGGRGMGDPSNFDHLERIADQLGAAVGASRAAVDTWNEIPHSMQVGQTGKTVNPSLYIAVGISGAIQHLAGMRTSKFIVAINKDPDAPIFKHADYGIVSTWEDALPALESSLSELL
ncbi:MAG: electron transfer flavoprotein subunit alpha [Euryarchaeota archaeon]|nr:electron transfer flavoprotein subunit alpha [Euryarchaeota archaeon]